MDYIAHIRSSDRKIQTVGEHLKEVKILAEQFGEKIGIKHLAGLAGMLHDMGKYTNDFRNYILEAVNNPDNPPKRGSVDHSTAGGKLLFELYHSSEKRDPYKCIIAEIVGNAIISHHSYLHDFLNPNLESPYLNRVHQKELNEYENTRTLFFEKVITEPDFHNYVDKAVAELKNTLAKTSSALVEQQLMFLTKFIFSILIDADRTNTREFEENAAEYPPVETAPIFEKYYERLMEKINSFKMSNHSESPINKLRANMSNQCDEFAARPSGVYTLSIPTGGGKTLASLRYALKHAKIHGKKRVVFVVPYTTIIEQNAEEVRKILQDDANILEHHSNVVIDDQDNDENQDGLININQKLKLAKDNWDAPIIFTTMVQYLNVFFAKGSRNIRRLHNLAESVIIFDEVQKVPIHCVSLFNQSLNFLKTNSKVSIVLCTATQPALDFVEHKLEINADGEIVQNLKEVVSAFERTEIVDKATGNIFDSEMLSDFVIDKIQEINSVLVILNTKSVVRKLYSLLKENNMGIPIYHLSTSMCAFHRNEILRKVRKNLKNNNKIICISTQLIEAGVDVSFECVIRSLAGLDSIAQAAGRCNRHGEKPLQQVYIIDHSEENLKNLKEIKVGKHAARKIFADLKSDKTVHGGSVLSTKAMERYFQEFYTDLHSNLNYFIPKLGKEMMELLSTNKREYSYHKAFKHATGNDLPLFLANSYRTAAEHFQVIDQIATGVIVPYGEGREIITELNGNGTIEDLSKLMRKAQQYTINLFPYELDHLDKEGGLVPYLNGKVLALKEGSYNEEFGLDLGGGSQLTINIF
ncbi:CRISPR-associated helicase/endonuclease Cas3 [Bacillus sp. FJAT-27445]|uniref:CRISPR-associated helicase/endonuclease Cas3 n=1 Tax=Bacillus sp. FJAT-27445 TaxID=1679166 RepID=UPI0007434096|nr:CRISPR-associated helicase/endonuclease Cas3 [Bacillus sp. FJAT-27445]